MGVMARAAVLSDWRQTTVPGWTKANCLKGKSGKSVSKSPFLQVLMDGMDQMTMTQMAAVKAEIFMVLMDRYPGRVMQKARGMLMMRRCPPP